VYGARSVRNAFLILFNISDLSTQLNVHTLKHLKKDIQPMEETGNINPLPSLMLQSAPDLNVPCWPKHSEVLLLSYTFKCSLEKTQSFCPCSRALNRSSKGLKKPAEVVAITSSQLVSEGF
jgi:hypothetical protein